MKEPLVDLLRYTKAQIEIDIQKQRAKIEDEILLVDGSPINDPEASSVSLLRLMQRRLILLRDLTETLRADCA